jgi:hypothetical protein
MSLRKAVNDKCKECIYDPKSQGRWRKQVEDCTSRLCPLYHERPVQIRNSSKKGKSSTIEVGVEV